MPPTAELDWRLACCNGRRACSAPTQGLSPAGPEPSIVQAVQKTRGLRLQGGAGHSPSEAFGVSPVGIGSEAVEFLLLAVAGARVRRDAIPGRHDRPNVTCLRRQRGGCVPPDGVRTWLLDDDIKAFHEHAR